MKVAFVPWTAEQLQDKIFDIDQPFNRDNCMLVYRQMKEYVSRNGGEIHTVDVYDSLKIPDIIVFFTFDEWWYKKALDEHLENKCVYIAFEPPVVDKKHAKKGLNKLGKLFNTVFTWDDDLLSNINKKIMYPYYFDEKWGEVKFADKKLMVNISGNKASDHEKELYSTRRKVINYFEGNDEFELYGTNWEHEGLHNYKGLAGSKAEVYHRFKFALCLENMKDVKGYVTEKILDCFSFGIVPVYQGAINVSDYIPKTCYIDYSEFSSLCEMEKFLKDMTEDEYSKYLSEIKNYLDSDKKHIFEIDTFIDTIISNANEGFSQGINFKCGFFPKIKFYFRYWLKGSINGKMKNIIKRIIKNTKSKFWGGGGVKVGDNTEIDKKSQIGDYTYIGRNCTITKAKIGRYVSIGNNCTIGPGEHDVSYFSTSSYLYDDIDWYEKLTEKDLIIGNDVWIGADSIIRRGIIIGDGAVIGANSFVNMDVPDYAIVVGSPARIIRYRFDKELCKKIKETKWWEKEPQEAKVILKKLRKECEN